MRFTDHQTVPTISHFKRAPHRTGVSFTDQIEKCESRESCEKYCTLGDQEKICENKKGNHENKKEMKHFACEREPEQRERAYALPL